MSVSVPLGAQSVELCVSAPHPYRLPDQRDGCPWPAAVPYPSEYRDPPEDQTGGLQAGQQRPAPSPGRHSGYHAQRGLLTAPQPPSLVEKRPETGVPGSQQLSRMDLFKTSAWDWARFISKRLVS